MGSHAPRSSLRSVTVAIQDRGYRLPGDIGLGLLGALVGGFVVGLFVYGDTCFFGSIVVATIGAVILMLLVRTVSGHRI